MIPDKKLSSEDAGRASVSEPSRKERVHEIIFGTDTPSGKRFDIFLIYAIVLSVIALMLDSVTSVSTRYGLYLDIIEWCFTIIFTAEYAIRIYVSPKPLRYIRSFYGIIDLLSVLPSYVGLIYPGATYLLIIRLFRVLRVFRVFKLVRYLSEANVLLRSMAMARRKIFIFFLAVLVLSTIFGALMYVVEGPENGFSSIPKSIYWTIVTITTVGYGDITPQTILGQIISSAAMLTGYSILAIPTGIITAELSQEIMREKRAKKCKQCESTGHDSDARYCKFCGFQF